MLSYRVRPHKNIYVTTRRKHSSFIYLQNIEPKNKYKLAYFLAKFTGDFFSFHLFICLFHFCLFNVYAYYKKRVRYTSVIIAKKEKNIKVIAEKKNECSFQGLCLETNVIYEAKVTTETTSETHLELATRFKKRL